MRVGEEREWRERERERKRRMAEEREEGKQEKKYH